MLKVLLVEDNELLQLLLKKFLEKNYEVIVSSDGKDAVKKIYSEMPDLIITDYFLPYILGDEVFYHGKLINTKVIIISVVNDGEFISDLFKRGLDDYMRKPSVILS